MASWPLFDINAVNRRGETPLHVASDSTLGDVAMIKYLVESAGANIDAKDTSGGTALHLASGAGQVPVVQYLVEEQGADVEACDADGCTALQLAVCNG
jgi:ankyrin repeat protein